MLKLIPLAPLLAALLLGAPLARAASTDGGHPDLTGVWMSPFRVHSSGLPMGSGQTPWLPLSAGDPKDFKIPTLDEISARVDATVAANHGNPTGADPFGQRGRAMPLTDAGKAAAAKLDPEKIEAQHLACYPTNVLTRLPGSPVQIVQNPKALAFMTEGGGPGRTIYMDGRSAADAIPQWNGFSVGHWEGDTLKIVTTAIRGETFQGANPMSDQARITEEYHLSPDARQLIGRITFEDPVYYREPLRKMIYLDRKSDVFVTDYTCLEGKDDMIETVAQKKP